MGSLVFTSGSALVAQAVTGSLAAKSELIATAQAGPASVVTRRIPAGTLLTGAPSTWLAARSFSPQGEAAIADFSPALLTTPNSIEYVLSETCTTIGTTIPKTATMGHHETVLRLHARATTEATITVDWSASVVPAGGGQRPVAQVDIFDDGTIDFTGVSPGSRLQVPVTLPMGVVSIRTLTRVHIEDPKSSPVVIGHRLRIRAEPTGSCSFVEIEPGCSPMVQRIEPRWLPGVDIVLPAAVSSGGRAGALVLGMQPAPVLLPFARCVLLPRPQIVLPVARAEGQEIRVPIDLSNPALRPIRFCAQTAVYEPTRATIGFTQAHAVSCPR